MTVDAWNRRQFLSLSVAACGTALAGCGFRLRSGNLQFPFRTIFIAGASTAMVNQLKRLLSTQVRVAEQATEAEVLLNVLIDREERSASALGTSAKVREVELQRQFDFGLLDSSGNTLIEHASISLRRFVSYNENEATAKEEEFELLLRDMRNETAQQVLRRLAATRPVVAQ